MTLIDGILKADRKAPSKQRHTAHRSWQWIRAERPELRVAESTIGSTCAGASRRRACPSTAPAASCSSTCWPKRYERRSTIITTNLAFSEWIKVFGDEKLTTALSDRLTHHSHILTTRGESYRTQRRRTNPEHETPAKAEDDHPPSPNPDQHSEGTAAANPEQS